ncbi:hypothetical protein MFLAVUS_006210 [Mucor flavus]|uniref:Peptidase S54 rhomboid domain-containing protein n=1 Tax=Mucor flavus TaxID=439312 RepID=A0ABP9Z0X5_9FUNG
MLRVSKLTVFKRQFSNAARVIPLQPKVIGGVYTKPSYIKPIVFGFATSTSIFFAAAFIHEKEKESIWQRLKKRKDGPKWSTIRDVITDDRLFLADFWEEKKKMWLEKKQILLDECKAKLEKYNSLPVEVKRLFLSGAQIYLSMSEAEKTMSVLIGLNILVFGAWKLPALKPFMSRYFTHNPSSGRSITLLTSCFSHRDIIRLSINMVGLWSFGPMLHDLLGREQFVASYLSFGIGSNVISHIISLSLRNSRPLVSSCGASGAMYGLLSGIMVSYPDWNVFIPYLPSMPIKISYAVPTLMSLDVAGIFMRWRMFDHFAHLGGASLGIAYMKVGPTYIWPTMLKTVRNLKKKGKGDGGDDNSGVLMEIPGRIRSRFFGKKVAVPEEH